MAENKKASADLLSLIIGLTLILSGVLFILNATNWGIFIAAICLLIEAAKHIIK